MPDSLSLEDRLDIHQLIDLYGHLIDDREFQQLHKIFTEDAIFDLIGLPGGRCEGLPAIQEMMKASTSHPLAHHATNIVIEVTAGAVSVRSKGIGVGHKGRVGSVVYRDQLQKTDQGWRIQKRLCQLRSVN